MVGEPCHHGIQPLRAGDKKAERPKILKLNTRLHMVFLKTLRIPYQGRVQEFRDKLGSHCLWILPNPGSL